jgi:Ca2+-binding EF-hand superfamily protein
MDQDKERIAELAESFAYNDRDDDGKIGLAEFKTMLDELESGIGDDDARIGFAAIDTDRDGAIELDEFLDWWSER